MITVRNSVDANGLLAKAERLVRIRLGDTVFHVWIDPEKMYSVRRATSKYWTWIHNQEGLNEGE